MPIAIDRTVILFSNIDIIDRISGLSIWIPIEMSRALSIEVYYYIPSSFRISALILEIGGKSSLYPINIDAE